MKKLLMWAALGLMLTTTPAISQAKTVKKHVKKAKVHKVVHHKKTAAVHHTTSGSTALATAPSSSPKTVPAKVGSHIKSAGHKISYNTWRLTHPNQAAAESASERAADAQREAADRAREAQYNKTH